MRKHNVEFIVQAGLGVILILLFLLTVTGMYQIREANRSMSHVVDENQYKVELAHEMRDAIRLREIGLNKMLATDDPFERDKLLLRFYEDAGIYRRAREKLLKLPVDEQEEEIHAELMNVIHKAQPLNRRAAELIASDASRQQIVSAVQSASIQQQPLLGLLNQLVDIQNNRAHEAVNAGTRKYDQSLYVVIMFGVIAVMGALYIVRRVSKYVAGKNQQLAEASEAALTANKTKSAFLATMSHEIRTPLTAIIGFAETSLESNQTILDRVNAIKTIIRSGRHLLQIINDILDLSKIEACKLEIEKINFSPFELMADIESIVQSLVSQKGLMFKIDYEFPIPKIIASDYLRLKQIIINLIGNAVKFTETGHVIVAIKYNKENNNLSFNVIDSGIGMSDAQMAIIFEAFNQADSSTTRKYGGTGLGLSLSRELALQLGGDITVKSLFNTGSQFELSVNAGIEREVEYVCDASEMPEIRRDEEIEFFTEKLIGTVLLAEDNSDNQRLIKHLINKLGITVDIAENGKIALQMARRKNYDLICMDMQMPVLNGLDAVEQLRRSGYRKPIVALTANAMRKDREDCLAAGCDDFLTKPINRRDLHRVMLKYLQIDDSCTVAETVITSQLLDGDPMISEIVEKFCVQLPHMYDNIKQLNQEKDWAKLNSVMHELKGVGGGMGFPVLTEMASKVQFQIINEDYRSVDSLVIELGEIVRRINRLNNESLYAISRVEFATGR